jgi:hypothetical protein
MHYYISSATFLTQLLIFRHCISYTSVYRRIIDICVTPLASTRVATPSAPDYYMNYHHDHHEVHDHHITLQTGRCIMRYIYFSSFLSYTNIY